MLKDSFKEIGKKVTPPTGFRLVEVDTFEPDKTNNNKIINKTNNRGGEVFSIQF